MQPTKAVVPIVATLAGIVRDIPALLQELNALSPIVTNEFRFAKLILSILLQLKNAALPIVTSEPLLRKVSVVNNIFNSKALDSIDVAPVPTSSVL